MNNVARVLFATAAVVAVALVGITGAGGPPSASPSAPPPSPSPTPSATPKSVQLNGDLQPGTYAAQLQLARNVTVTFTVPGGWSAYGDGALLGLVPTGEPGTGWPGGIAFQFRDVTALKAEPCHWNTRGADIRVGPTADDLVQALQEQTAFEVSEPVPVVVGGYAGQRIDIVSPTEPFRSQGTDAIANCNLSEWRFWDGDYSKGPANRWQTNILDVDGTRLVIVVQDFPGTTAADRAQLDAILDSMVIEP